MGAEQIREELHQFIDTADDGFLKRIYALVQADMTESDHQLSSEHKKILDSRILAHEAHPSTGRSWEETKSRIKDRL